MISYRAVPVYTYRNGPAIAAAQKADTLPKWWCQNSGAISGNKAMDNSMQAKGMQLHSGRTGPRSL